MTTNNGKTVRGLYKGRALANELNIYVDFMLVFQCEMEYDDGDESEGTEGYWAILKFTGAWAFIGSHDEKNTPPHNFESLELRNGGAYLDVAIFVDEAIGELAAEIATNNTVSEYAESVLNYWRGEIKIDTVTITEAV